jgi:Ras-related protein Rab-8A
MGILLTYDVTDENSFQNIRNWMKNIEEYAAENVNKILIGNKCDLVEKKVVDTQKGQQLAASYGIQFLETSAKNNINVEEAFISIARDIKARMIDNGDDHDHPKAATSSNTNAGNDRVVDISASDGGATKTKGKGCC